LTGIKFDKKSVTIKVGESATLKLVPIPSDATLPKCNFESDDESVATVNSSGKVTAKAEGETTITAKTTDGKFSAKCTVTVTPKGGGYETKLIEYTWTRSFNYYYNGYTWLGFEYWDFYTDGTFVQDYWYSSILKYTGNYTVSDGKITLTNIKKYWTDKNFFHGKEGDMKYYVFEKDCWVIVTEFQVCTDENNKFLLITSLANLSTQYAKLSDCYTFYPH